MVPGLTAYKLAKLIALIEPSPSNTKSLVGNVSSPSIPWLIDSGASHHMTGSLEAFSTTRDISPSPVGLPDGVQTNATKEGTIHLSRGLILCNVLYVPNLAVNLISKGCLITDADCFITFTHNLCVIQDRITSSPIGLSRMQSGVFMFQPVLDASSVAVQGGVQYDRWHQRLGHASSHPLSLISGIQIGSKSDNKLCDVCCQAKQTRSFFSC